MHIVKTLGVLCALVVSVALAGPASAQDLCLELDGPRPGIAGEFNEFSVFAGDDVPQEGIVWLIYGFDDGRTPIPGCDASVQIIKPRIAGKIALIEGQGAIEGFVPKEAAGQVILFQAVYRTSCCISNLVITEFE